ncbi:gustatory receptor for sugar taste 64a-like [Epargyreus clarus]|uniref:gustatory receptor for sugar taste 64a-like n=1 Tax=Epargyreus clarus TaxID=520877 RepID=UPI003C3012EC
MYGLYWYWNSVNHQYFPFRFKFLPTITFIFTIAKWFGIPVYGGRGFLCLAVSILSMLVMIEVAAIWKVLRAIGGYPINVTDNRGVTARLSGAIYYGNAVLSLICSWKLIRTWKGLSKYWLRIERNSGIYLRPDGSIKRRLVFVSRFVAFCACFEHMLSMMSATGFDCPPSEYFKRYILTSHGFLLQPYNYNIWVAMLIFLMSKVSTVLWNFQDLIVILISMGLASRYHRLNLLVSRVVMLERRAKKYKNSAKLSTGVYTWRMIRRAYVKQAELVRKVDNKLGLLIILSTLNNFYFICLQLFLGLRLSGGPIISSVYYFTSLAWLLFRACSVVLAAADVNLHSQRALITVCGCPSARYNVEIKRLEYQLIHDNVFLTGLGLFHLDRNKLLEIAASILKYELILLQFDQ